MSNPMTKTFAVLEVSNATWCELQRGLSEAGYAHCLKGEYVFLPDIALKVTPVVGTRNSAAPPGEHSLTQPKPRGLYAHNPEHAFGTCCNCGKEMVANVPRMGLAGGFVHKETGSFACKMENVMRTRQCPGCEKLISERLATCPHCGYSE